MSEVSINKNETHLNVKSEENQLEGIGIVLEKNKHSGSLFIVSIVNDSPADKNGLKINDVILKIDEKYTNDLSLNDSIEIIRGIPGTRVYLRIKRDNEFFNYNLTREKINIFNHNFFINDTFHDKYDGDIGRRKVAIIDYYLLKKCNINLGSSKEEMNKRYTDILEEERLTDLRPWLKTDNAKKLINIISQQINQETCQFNKVGNTFYEEITKYIYPPYDPIFSIEKISKIYKKIEEAEKKGNTRKVIDYYKEKASIEEKYGIRDFTTYWSIARNYKSLGRNNEAKLFQLKAIAIAESKYGSNSLAVAELLDSLATMYYEKGYIFNKLNFEELENIYRRSLSIRLKILGRDNLFTSNSYSNLAGLYAQKSEYNESIRYRKLAIEIAEQANDKVDFYQPKNLFKAFLYSQIGGDYQQIGELKKAQQYFNKSLKIRKKSLPSNSPLIAEAYEELASVDFFYGRYDKALQLLDEVNNIYQLNSKKYAEEIVTNRRMVNTINIMKKLIENQGEFLDFNEEDIIKDISIEDPTAHLQHQLNGFVYLSAGMFDEAINELIKVKKILVDDKGYKNKETANVLFDLGRVYAYNNQLDKAIKSSLSSYKIFKSLYGDSNLSFQSIGLYNQLAALYIVSDNNNEAEKFLNKVLKSYTLYIQKQAQFIAEEKRIDFLKFIKQTSPFDQIIYSQINSLPNGYQLALKARLNTHGLLEEIERNQAKLFSLNEESSQLFKKLKDLNIKLGNLMLDKGKRNEILNLKLKTEEKLYELLPELKPIIVEIDKIANAIPDNSVLVEFQHYQPIELNKFDDSGLGEPRYLALTLNNMGEIEAIDLGLAVPIEERIQQALIASEEGLGDALQLWSEVGDLVIKPLQEAIGDSETVFISPDAELNRVPFSALSSHKDNSLLSEVIDIRLLTTGRELLDLNQASNEPHQEPLVVANPSFNLRKNVSSLKLSELNPSVYAQQRSDDLGSFIWSPLPGTAKEGIDISNLINAQLLTKERATTLALQEEESPQILHIASHAYFLANKELLRSKNVSSLPQSLQEQLSFSLKGENPLLRSGIVLAGANQPEENPEDDGYLTALEVAKLDWQGTEMVVISGCESGKGDIQSGEGVYGLKRAIAVAGARSSLLSLWKVDDRATAAFMTSFYKKLKDGDGRADALVATQKEFRNHSIPGWRHPYVWAAFQLSGDWRPIRW